jgi:pyruvate dehydrogenase E2 component (dihydrolipoamide acetyltransferase)
MPKWGLSMENGKVVHWWKSEGDRVNAGEDLLDIETAKIVNTAEAPASGVLRRIVTPLDETAPVGALLGVIAETDVSDADIDLFVANLAVEGEAATADDGGQRIALQQVPTRLGDLQVGRLESEAGGETVVLIHGFASDLNSWLFTFEPVRQAGRIIAIDLPGHGGSSKAPGDASLEALAGAVIDALTSLGVETAHLVGHSLGAAVATAVALQSPGLVRSLVLIAPPALVGGAPSSEFLDGIVEGQRARDLRAPLAMLVRDPDLVSKDMIEGVLRAKRVDGAEEWLRALRDRMLESQDLADLKARAGSIPAALVIGGSHDQIVGSVEGGAVPPGWRVETILETGHMPHLERSAEVNRLILAHILSNTP